MIIDSAQALRPQHLSLLAAFACVAEVGSFSKAARVMGLSQPAISQQVRRLECALAASLFERSARGVKLTEDGETLYQAVASGLAGIQSAAARIRNQGAEQSVSVATDFGFAALWLIPKLQDFRAAHPGIELRLITGQRDFDLAAENIDVWVRCGPTDVPGTLSHHLLAECVTVVASPEFLANHGPIARYTDLEGLPLLALEGDRQGRWFDWGSWVEQAHGQSLPLAAPLRFDNYGLLVQAAIAGQGLALGWLPLVAPALEQGTLVQVFPRVLRSNRGYHVTLPAEQTLCDGAWRFYHWLRNEVNRSLPPVQAESNA